MKYALLPILCSITIAITEQYESNSSLLVDKLTTGDALPRQLTIAFFHVFSIQINMDHVCSGFSYNMGSFVLMTTAECARKVTGYLNRPPAERPVLRACSEGLHNEDSCSAFDQVAINKHFSSIGKNKPYSPENAALFLINMIVIPEEEKSQPNANIPLTPDNKVGVVGFEFHRELKFQESDIMRSVRYTEAVVFDHRECASRLDLDLGELHILRKGICIKPCINNVRFEEEDVGIPVFHNFQWIGIIAVIAKDGKSAFVVRPSTTKEEYNFMLITNNF